MKSLMDSLVYKPIELDFGTSGLRGLVVDMTDLEVYINTAGFIAFLESIGQLKNEDDIFIAGDLRNSTPKIMKAVCQAIIDSGYAPHFFGYIPTPALAYYSLYKQNACIMITGSHIPADRNGIKFYRKDGEVLKEDELGIKNAVAKVRQKLYSVDSSLSIFDSHGNLKSEPDLPKLNDQAEKDYANRYLPVFSSECLKGKKIVFYQHSAVGREILVSMFEKLGATVVTVGRSETFIPLDSENVTKDNEKYFAKTAREHPDALAIVSTDGDSDRPLVIDEHGEFHRGDVLGAVAAEWLRAEFAAYPVSSSDAVDTYLNQLGVPYQQTKIGSPYVISAMEAAVKGGQQKVVGWEVNGGFMTATDFVIDGSKLRALPTRDAFLPILLCLLSALDKKCSVSELFGKFPGRYTQAGLIDNFPTAVSLKMVGKFSNDSAATKKYLAQYFNAQDDFGNIDKIVTTDGIRVFFDNGDIAHMRPSGNAPQLRIYSVANDQKRADQIVELAIKEPSGIFRSIEAGLSL